MSNEHPKQLVKDGFIASSTLTVTESTMIFAYKVNKVSYFLGFLAGLVFFIFIFINLNSSTAVIGLFFAGYIFFIVLGEGSYTYEFYKTLGQIKYKKDGFLILGTPEEKTYSLSDIAHIKVVQIRSRYSDSFKIKLVLKYGNELTLLSGSTLDQCMEHANTYKDFLEINEPIKFK